MGNGGLGAGAAAADVGAADCPPGAAVPCGGPAKAKKEPPVKPLITPPEQTVLVKRAYTKPFRRMISLRTDSPFDGSGTFTRSGKAVRFFTTATSNKEIAFNGTDNVFSGAQLTAGVPLFAEGAAASTALKDITIRLTLSGGSKKFGPAATAQLTAVELTLDICQPRPAPGTDPVPLPMALAPPAMGTKPTDKYYLGRPVPVEADWDASRPSERAKLIIRPPKPAAFKGNLQLKATGDAVHTFPAEAPKKGEAAIPKLYTVATDKVPAKGLDFFIQGVLASKARETEFLLGVEGLDEDGDRVSVTAVYVEAASNVERKDIKTVALVPEKPERKSKSKYAPAPSLVGLKYDVELRPYVELGTPSAYQWSSNSPHVALTDTGKEVLKVKGNSLSAKLNDVEVDLLLTMDVGRMRKKHQFTVVKVTIDPVASGDVVKHNDDINKIKNPASLVILTGADATDPTKVPKIEMLKFPVPGPPAKPAALGIEPNLGWTDDDDRIAWWIIGGDAKGDNKYDGKADFLNTEAGKRGTKVQAYGVTAGDVLIQPYSGGYAYGMFRTHVVPIRKIKYRISRIFTTAQAAQPATPVVPALPAQAAQPAFPGTAGVAPQPAVPNLPAVAARPAMPAVLARAAHAPTQSHAEAALHMKVSNIFLRQIGIEMIPDDSAQMASPQRAASAGFPAVAAQPAIAAQVATPALPGVPPRPPVPARPAVPALPALPAVAASAFNPNVGQPDGTLDGKIVQVTRVQQGHFDVEVNDDTLTFNSAANQIAAVRINARNEVISVAYIEQDPTLGGGTTTLSTALLCPANHAPKDKTRQPEGAPNQNGTLKAYSTANFTLPDLGTPSSSLIPKTGIPPDAPADKVKMFVLQPDVNWQPNSPANRDIDLLLGIIVPTRNMDSAVKAPVTADATRHMYGFVFAHEMGHILGLGHRGHLANPVTDGLAIPADQNIMRPFVNAPVTENFDIIQAKAVRFSELMNRTP